jgi:cytochrome c nitrite reductase small subunit
LRGNGLSQPPKSSNTIEINIILRQRTERGMLLYLTLRKEPQVIFIKEAGREVLQGNCIRCHSDLLSHRNFLMSESELYHSKTDRKCWECHREVPHGRVNSLSSTPNARVPLLESPVPEWLKVKLKK